jgi:hypothetical protein
MVMALVAAAIWSDRLLAGYWQVAPPDRRLPIQAGRETARSKQILQFG